MRNCEKHCGKMLINILKHLIGIKSVEKMEKIFFSELNKNKYYSLNAKKNIELLILF
jgi:hypothetical protein